MTLARLVDHDRPGLALSHNPDRPDESFELPRKIPTHDQKLVILPIADRCAPIASPLAERDPRCIDLKRCARGPPHAPRVAPEPVARPEPVVTAAPAPAQARPSGLNPLQTFETFVVGECNKLAHAAAQAVADGGEPAAQDAMRRYLKDFRGWDAEIPRYGDEVEKTAAAIPGRR